MSFETRMNDDDDSLARQSFDHEEEDHSDSQYPAVRRKPAGTLRGLHTRRKNQLRDLNLTRGNDQYPLPSPSASAFGTPSPSAALNGQYTSNFSASTPPPSASLYNPPLSPTATFPKIIVENEVSTDHGSGTPRIPIKPDAQTLEILVKPLEDLGRERRVDQYLTPANETYAQLEQSCKIQILDYSTSAVSDTSKSSVMNNAGLESWSKDPEAVKRPKWAKVRWINVAGISRDVVSTLALKHGMHNLAVKHLLQHGARTRSKSEYYPQHLYLRVLTHVLRGNADSEEAATDKTNPGGGIREGLSAMVDSLHLASLSNLDLASDAKESPQPSGQAASQGDASSDAVLQQLSSSQPATRGQPMNTDRVDVHLELLHMFVFASNDPDDNGGTLITFHSRFDSSFTKAITDRLADENSLLRQNADVSILLYGLLDLVGDRTLEVADAIRRRLQRVEQDVLKLPGRASIWALHILSHDLFFYKRTMGSIKTLIYELRRYDADRYRVAMGHSASEEGVAPERIFSPYVAQQASLCLTDVYDHMEYALENIDMYTDMTEKLIASTLNMASYDMNNDMRSLTLVTVIFFPLTLLTGYFGMNFEAMWSVQTHTDLLFWKIALPVLAVCMLLFLYKDMTRAVRLFIQDRRDRRMKNDASENGKLRKMA